MPFIPDADLEDYIQEYFPGVTLPVTSDRLIGYRDAFELAFERDINQNVILTTEDRYFDGNNSEFLATDYIVDNGINSVDILYAGSSMYTLDVNSMRTRTVGKKPPSQIEIAIPNASTGATALGYGYNIFPRGVANILINADWGIAATCPPDILQVLKDYVLAEVLQYIRIRSTANGGGVLPLAYQEGDRHVMESTIIAGGLPTMTGLAKNSLGIMASYSALVRRYKLPSQNLRNRGKRSWLV